MRTAFANQTDVAGDTEKLRERLARINARAPVYTVIHGDIDLNQLFNTSGFMLEEKVVSATPRFHLLQKAERRLVDCGRARLSGGYQ